MEPIKKIYQKHWNNYGINYVTNIYKTHFEVERFFTNGWQNSD